MPKPAGFRKPGRRGKALELAVKLEQRSLAEGLRGRIRYENGRPYRQPRQ